MRRRSIFALCSILTFSGSGVWANEPASGPKAKVRLVPFSNALVAGQPLEVGIQFELETGWHIYWQNSGDAGASPVIEWKLPEGFETGEIRYPTPRKHISPGDIITNILKGEPVLTATIHPPAQLAAGEVSLGAKVISFVCAENCIQEQAEVSVKLPVATSSEPVNEDILKRALRSQPKSSSKVIGIQPVVAGGPVTPGSKFELILEVEIARKHHIQSHNPTLPSLIPAEVFMHRVPGVRLGKAVYPQPKFREDKYLGKLSEYEGKITVRIPGEVDGEHRPGPVKLAGVFTYQACEDNGNCLPPEALGFSHAIDIVANGGRAEAGVAGTTLVAESSSNGVSIGEVSEPAVQAALVPQNANGIDGVLNRFGLAGLLLGCFLYGLFINATPCVLPLLSIKVLGFVQQAHESRKKTTILGLAFGAGVIIFFVVLGLLAAQGRNIQQFPIAVIILGAVVLAMALSMLGVFTLHVPTSATSLEARIQQEGPLASFAKGAFAPVLGLACTGPLLAGAFAWASQQKGETAILAFSMMGLGMASPYMVLGANPGWLSFLPRPGMWMVTFERIMGFLLLAMVVWLVHPLSQQIGVTGLEWTLVFYVAVGMACWLLGRIQITMPALVRWKFRLSAVFLVLISSVLVYGWVYPLDKAANAAECEQLAMLTCTGDDFGEHIAWKPWSNESVRETVSAGKIAFVDFTAAYCTVCKVNKKVAIDTPEFIRKLTAIGATAFRADFTDFDQDIADALMKFKGSNLVPLNLIYPPGRPDEPLVLETNLTTDYLLQKLDEAQSLSSRSASARPGGTLAGSH